MKTILSMMIILFASLLVTEEGICKAKRTKKAAPAAKEWGYSGVVGPDKWANLSPAYKLCSNGKNQSPVDLTKFTQASLPLIQFNYSGGKVEEFSDCRLLFSSGNKVMFDDKPFELREIRFHNPSEHTINGVHYPIEVHLIHVNSSGNFAIFSVIIVEGSGNASLDEILKNVPKKKGDKVKLEKGLFIGDLLPKNKDYFRYDGSLTTPPCTEGVRWLIFKNAVTASKTQIKGIEDAIGHKNNRPVQSLNARIVLK